MDLPTHGTQVMAIPTQCAWLRALHAPVIPVCSFGVGHLPVILIRVSRHVEVRVVQRIAMGAGTVQALAWMLHTLEYSTKKYYYSATQLT